MTTSLKVKNLKKHFGKTKAVDGISFEVQKGEIFGFLGPNGAGKTTTIRTMMDFIRPIEGKIEILGYDAQKDSVKLKNKIGYISNNARLYDNWSVQKHLNYQQIFKGKSKKADELMKLFNLNRKLRFKNLSSGNRQKLSIVLALMNDPEILILDEPTVALDPLLQNTFHSYLRNYVEGGGTVFMSSHNLAEVEKVCDRVAIIKEGKLVAVEKIFDMKLMKMYDVSFHAEGADPKSFVDKNVELVSHSNGLINLKVKGDIGPIITKLSKLKIKDLEITHVSLEDIFMEFYKK